MSVWMNKFTCPGFVFCPRKPHLKGNEYHTICFGESGIMYVWEIVEGMDHPITMRQPEFESSTNMKTVGIIIRLTRLRSITGKAVITEIVFCVLKGLLEIMQRRVYGSVLIKRGATGLGGFMEMALTITSGQKILVM